MSLKISAFSYKLTVAQLHNLSAYLRVIYVFAQVKWKSNKIYQKFLNYICIQYYYPFSFFFAVVAYFCQHQGITQNFYHLNDNK